MNPEKIAAAALLALVVAGAWPLARAQGLTAAEELALPPAPSAPSAAEPLPAPPAIAQGEKGTRYLSGGISLEERQAMSQLARGFPLRITSARPDSALVSGVGVRISDSRGRDVLAVPEAGPLVYVSLPPGKYTVSMSKDGQVESRRVILAAGQRRELAFFWQG
jgi:hypothetical protein